MKKDKTVKNKKQINIINEEEYIKQKKEEKNKKNKNKEKIKNVIIFCSIFVFICLFVYIAFIFSKLIKSPNAIYVVKKGEVINSENVKGYIIREESVVNNEGYTNSIIKIKQEGEKIAKGDAIYRYSSGNENEIEKKISEIDNEIQNIIKKEDNTFSTDKKLLETQIEDVLLNTYGQNEVKKIQENKKNIDSFIYKKARVVGLLSPSGSRIKQLLEERTKLEENLTQDAKYICAENSGIVSYKVDELENVLKTDDLGIYNKEFLKKLNLKTGQIISSNENTCKTVNNYYCYVIFNSDSADAKNCKVNDKIKIQIHEDNKVSAVIDNIIEESDGSRTIALKLEKEVESIIDYRCIAIEVIWWMSSGYKVPNSAIIEENGINYVVRNRSGYTNRMAVKVLKKSENYSIIEDYPKAELNKAGVDEDIIDSLKTLTLYDEILVSPEEKQ